MTIFEILFFKLFNSYILQNIYLCDYFFSIYSLITEHCGASICQGLSIKGRSTRMFNCTSHFKCTVVLKPVVKRQENDHVSYQLIHLTLDTLINHKFFICYGAIWYMFVLYICNFNCLY